MLPLREAPPIARSRIELACVAQVLGPAAFPPGTPASHLGPFLVSVLDPGTDSTPQPIPNAASTLESFVLEAWGDTTAQLLSENPFQPAV